MLAQIIKIREFSTPRVNFYTIQFDGKKISEFADFHARLSVNEENNEELNEIFDTLDNIGKRGAFRKYFREEDNAYALPPKDCCMISTYDYGIRLYCVVLSPRIVILMNGNRKKTQKALEEGSNVSKFFRQANSLHEALIKSKNCGEINWDDYSGLNYDDDYLVDVKG